MTNSSDMPPLDQAALPPGVRSRFVAGVNGLRMHVLEAGFATPGRPCVLLLHGFPELAYSWRKVMPALAEAGFHVVAPDQRGYGRTTGWDPAYDGDLRSFRLLNLVGDAVALLHALGLRTVHAVVGHDFGASVAAWCALLRPDVFRSVALMSAPFAGPPAWSSADAGATPDIHAALAALPRPRKHYQWHYATREANAEMWRSPQGVHAFLRAYFHNKSADWRDNRPQPLTGWTARELAKLPTYYIMDLGRGMAETVAAHAPSATEVAACGWLTEAELAAYAAEYTRTGFQGGLQWYRCRTEGVNDQDLRIFSGRTIDVPAIFVAGAQDWGIHQAPGALEAMRERACTRLLGIHLIEGAGHWVQQERPEAVNARLLEFLEPSD
jgi:pimeloyl-ACP methyl ester carboxylesterase